MLELVTFLYILQLFLMSMGAINIVIGIATFLADNNKKDGSKLVATGMVYGLVSMILGMISLSMMK